MIFTKWVRWQVTWNYSGIGYQDNVLSRLVQPQAIDLLERSRIGHEPMIAHRNDVTAEPNKSPLPPQYLSTTYYIWPPVPDSVSPPMESTAHPDGIFNSLLGAYEIEAACYLSPIWPPIIISARPTLLIFFSFHLWPYNLVRSLEWKADEWMRVCKKKKKKKT